MAHRPQYCEIAFVVDFLNRCVVSINAKDQHGQVVGSEGYAVNSLVDKLVDQQYCRGNFYHDPELEIWASFQSFFLEDLLRVSDVLCESIDHLLASSLFYQQSGMFPDGKHHVLCSQETYAVRVRFPFDFLCELWE